MGVPKGAPILREHKRDTPQRDTRIRGILAKGIRLSLLNPTGYPGI